MYSNFQPEFEFEFEFEFKFEFYKFGFQISDRASLVIQKIIYSTITIIIFAS